MNQQKQKILIVETKDGAKYQGIYVSKDIQKQTITLSNVKKTFQGNEEQLPNIELTKDNIARIDIIDVRPPKEDIHNINEIPENKKSAIDENKLANVEKAYDKSKDDFFDHLKPMSNPEVKKESKYYNKKNKDTFNLPEDTNENNREWRGKGYGRGRGRGRGGYRGRYNNYYNNQKNYGGYDNKNGGNSNYQGQNYYNKRGRGRGRGRGRQNRGGYKSNNNNSGENNQNNNIANQNDQNKIINNEPKE